MVYNWTKSYKFLRIYFSIIVLFFSINFTSSRSLPCCGFKVFSKILEALCSETFSLNHMHVYFTPPLLESDAGTVAAVGLKVLASAASASAKF